MNLNKNTHIYIIYKDGGTQRDVCLCVCVHVCALCSVFRFRRWVNPLRKQRETLPNVDFGLHPSLASSSHSLHYAPCPPRASCPTSISGKPERLHCCPLCSQAQFAQHLRGRGWNNGGRLTPLKAPTEKVRMSKTDSIFVANYIATLWHLIRRECPFLQVLSVSEGNVAVCEKQTVAKTICWQCLHITHVEY